MNWNGSQVREAIAGFKVKYYGKLPNLEAVESRISDLVADITPIVDGYRQVLETDDNRTLKCRVTALIALCECPLAKSRKGMEVIFSALKATGTLRDGKRDPEAILMKGM
jgi:uncharacterized protein involved in exopolysaccharide biosynthesis